MFCVEAILVFSLTGQVNAKKGENMYTKESAFLMVWLKNQKIKYISTYENEASWAGLFKLGIELQMPQTGRLHKNKKQKVHSRDCACFTASKKKQKDHKYNLRLGQFWSWAVLC